MAIMEWLMLLCFPNFSKRMFHYVRKFQNIIKNDVKVNNDAIDITSYSPTSLPVSHLVRASDWSLEGHVFDSCQLLNSVLYT